MALKIEARTVGGVTILDVVGRITLGEGSSRLRNTVINLMNAGKNNLLVNMTKVSYIDSSGIGEMVSAAVMVRNKGGQFKLLNLTKRVQDLLQITKFYTFFEVHNDEAQAVRSFNGQSGTVSLRCRCPVCGFWSTPPLDSSAGWLPQTCMGCRSQFAVEPSHNSPADSVVAKTIRVESYQQEYCHLLCGASFIIEIHGRLTMFSHNAVLKIWNLVPKPRKVMFDLRGVTELESGGHKALVELVNGGKDDSRATISIEGLARAYADTLPDSPPFYRERTAALAALGDVSDTPALLISVGEF
jgi:anti-sigma B factor antagonist